MLTITLKLQERRCGHTKESSDLSFLAQVAFILYRSHIFWGQSSKNQCNLMYTTVIEQFSVDFLDF